MTQVLKINSSLFGNDGVSSQLSDDVLDALRHQHSDLQVVERDVVADPIPHFDAATIEAIGNNTAALADTLIAEIQAADVLILGVPMYNFAMPSQLKAWFDHIARAGVTFKYTENGPVGLLKNKKAYVLASRGGLHKGEATDTQTSYLQTMLGFIGITDLHIIYAEGLNMGEELRTKAIGQAKAEIQALSKTTEKNQYEPA